MENYKLVILGSGGVGKSALTIQLVQNRFVAAYDPTIEDSYKKTLCVDDHDVSLDILDTAGQDDFAAIRATYMRSGNGFIVVFAVNDPSSFDAVDKFQTDIKVTSQKEDIPIIVCGNKCDLPDRDVTEEEAKQYCQEHGLVYFETSAKSNVNVQEAFMEAIRLMRKHNKAVQDGDSKAEQGGKSGGSDTKANKDANSSGGGCCNIA